EDHGDVQPRVLDRVVLDRVGELGPGAPGVARRAVGAAGEDRAGVVLDQHGCSGSALPPALAQVPLAGLVLSRSWPTRIWSIWPIFSASVIRWRRSSTRAVTGAPASR